MSQTSAALGRIQPSATLAMSARVNALKAEGVDVIGLSAGEPDFDTPDFVKEAGIAAIRGNQTRYTDVDGTAGVKDAVAFKFKRDNGIEYARNQISVNSGGKHTLFNALVATVEAGDEDRHQSLHQRAILRILRLRPTRMPRGEHPEQRRGGQAGES